MAVSAGLKRDRDLSTRSRWDLRVLVRRSSEGRPAMSWPSAIQLSPKARSMEGASHSGISARMWPGVVSGSWPTARARSSSVSGSGAWLSAAKAVAERRGVFVPVADGDGEDEGARAVAAHQGGVGGAAAQGVIDQVADGGAVPCPGEAVVESPGLERLGNRALAGLHIGQDIDGGGQSAGKAHGRARGRTTRRSTSHSQKMASTARPAV